MGIIENRLANGPKSIGLFGPYIVWEYVKDVQHGNFANHEEAAAWAFDNLGEHGWRIIRV